MCVRRFAPSGGRRLSLAVSLCRAAAGSTSRCYRAAGPRWCPSVPQLPLVAPRRLLTSAAATTPAALSALSGLAQMPRRRRFGGRRGQRAPFLCSDGASGNQWYLYAAQIVSVDAVSHAFGDQMRRVADKGSKYEGEQRRTRRPVAGLGTPVVVLKLRASSGGHNQLRAGSGLAGP